MYKKEFQRREDELRRLRPTYNKDREFAEEFNFGTAVDVLYSYKAGEPSEKAVYVLAQCQTLLFDVYKALRSVKQFETKEAQLNSLKAKLPAE